MRIRELFRCEICENVVELLYPGAPSLVCCGQPMDKLEAKTEDEGQEKHVPVVAKTGEGIRVKVGSNEHPMTDKHYVVFIEVLTEDKVYRAELKPDQKPEAVFPVKEEDVLETREFCNVHMLWKN